MENAKENTVVFTRAEAALIIDSIRNTKDNFEKNVETLIKKKKRSKEAMDILNDTRQSFDAILHKATKILNQGR